MDGGNDIQCFQPWELRRLRLATIYNLYRRVRESVEDANCEYTDALY